MRENDFPSLIKKNAVKRANYRCERCWSEIDPECHHIFPLKSGGLSNLDNCIVLCHNCHNIAPQDPFLLKNFFLRFASTKELINHYNSKNEVEALKLFCIETNIDFQETIKKIRNDPCSHVYAIKDGMKKCVKNRGHAGFNIPFGFDYKGGILRINQNESKIVKNIYSWYLSGKSIGEISRMLNSAHIPTKRGGLWAKKTISTILKNPIYCGYHKWMDIVVKANHEKIIDIVTFNRIQKKILQQNGKPSVLELK